MTNTLLFLTRPLVILLLWISLAVCLWYTLSPPFLIDISFLPWSSEQVLIVLFIILFALSLLSTLQTRSIQKVIAWQSQQNKQAIKALKQAHQKENYRIQALTENEQFAYWEWNVKTNKVQYSSQWKKMLGLEQDVLLNNLHDMQNRIHPKDQKAVQQKLLKVLSGKEHLFECTHRIQHEDGHYIWVHDKGQVYLNNNGEIERIFAIRIDVSEQKWIESELEVDSIIIEHAFEGIAITGDDLKIQRCNNTLCQSLNQTREELKGSNLIELINGLQNEVDDSIIATFESEGAWRGELTLFDDNNEISLASRISIQKIFHETTQTTHYSFIHSDITHLKKTQAALDNLANVDSVTGLANRHKLYNTLENVLNSKTEITLMFLDLDNFKNVNDTLGHDIGDLLLKQVGQEISKLIPDQSLLARVGGDEFVFYYEPHSSSLSSTEIAQRITDRLKQPFYIKDNEINIGSSIGIAHYPQHSFDRHSLLKASDMAMYQAKRAGKGQFREFSEELTAVNQ